MKSHDFIFLISEYLQQGCPKICFVPAMVVWGKTLLEHYFISLVCIALEKQLGSMKRELDSSKCSSQEDTEISEKESILWF